MVVGLITEPFTKEGNMDLNVAYSLHALSTENIEVYGKDKWIYP